MRREQREREELERERKRLEDTTITPQLDLTENPNRGPAIAVAASSVDDALAQLSLNEGGAVDFHPEKRMKAAWRSYEVRFELLLQT